MTTLRVVTTYPDAEAMDAIIKAFQDLHPNIRVVRKQAGNGEKGVPALKEAIEKGEADVVDAGWAGMLMGTDLLLPLEPYVLQSAFRLDPFGQGLEVLRIDGRLYELPTVVMAYPISYNKAQFEAAQLPLPKSNWTWDEFQTAAARLTKKAPEQPSPGFDSPMGFFLIQAWVSERAGRPYWSAEDQAVRDGLAYFGSLLLADRSLGASDGGAIVSAMTIAGFTGQTRRPGLNVAPLPTFPGTRSVLEVEPWTYGIAHNSPNASAAWEFLRFAAGEEGAVAVARAGQLPMYNTPAVRAVFQEQKQPDLDSLYDSTWIFIPHRNRSIPFAILRMAGDDLLTGKKDAESAFAQYTKQMTQFRGQK